MRHRFSRQLMRSTKPHFSRRGDSLLFSRSYAQYHPAVRIPEPPKPTFVRGASNDESIMPVIVAFMGGFAGTVLLLSTTSKAEPKARLLPNKYTTLGLLETRRCSSPSDLVGRPDGEHVYLSIEPPDYIAPPKLKPEHVGLTAGAGESLWRILSLYMKEPALQIERPYTPLYADALQGPLGSSKIELLIKRYPDGELGRYAHRIERGAGIEVRGPEVTWQGKPKDHLVMLVGGTGITPAYQLLTSVLGKPGDQHPLPGNRRLPRVTLMYAVGKPSSLLLLPELKQLERAYPDHLRIQLYAEQLDDSITISWSDWLLRRKPEVQGIPLQGGRLSSQSIKDALRDASELSKGPSKQILVCGPDGMIQDVAGAKDGQRQGPLGGILASLGCNQEEVWKL